MRGIESWARLLASAGRIAVGIVLGAGALSKLIDPRSSFELAEAVTANPWASSALVGLALALESGLAVAICLGLLPGAAALRSGLAVLLAFTAWLFVARSTVGGEAECGCLTVFRRDTITDALLGNAILIGELAVALAADRWARGRGREEGGPVSAPSTSE